MPCGVPYKTYQFDRMDFQTELLEVQSPVYDLDEKIIPKNILLIFYKDYLYGEDLEVMTRHGFDIIELYTDNGKMHVRLEEIWIYHDWYRFYHNVNKWIF